MNMTNRETHSHEADPMEYRLRRYGTTLDASVGFISDVVPQRDSTARNRQLSEPRQQARSRRKLGYAMGTVAAGALSTLAISVLSFGGNSNTTTIITADGPTPKHLVTAGELKAAYLAVQAQSTMVFPVAKPASFADTFGSPRMTGTPFASRHDGIDIFGVAGARVYAMTGGVASLRSFDVKPIKVSPKAHGGLQYNPTPWRHDSSTFDETEQSQVYHLQFVEVTQSDSTVVVYSNLEPVVADKQEIRVGQFIGTLMTSSPIVQPPHLHIAQYSPGLKLKDSLPFIPVSPGQEYRANNIYPLLKSLLPAPGQPAIPIDVQGISVSSAIAPRLRSLLDAAKADGFTNISGNGYRSPGAQIALRKAHCGTTDFDIYVKPSSQCKPPTMRPGNSDHERGVAVDFSHNRKIVTADEPFLGWLTKHAADYGFTGIADEPWHWSADPVSPVSAKAEVGSTIGTLEIETAKVNVLLLEGAEFEELKKGAGRERLSSPLGENGETVIRCQRTTYGAPCFDLQLVKPNAKIVVRTNGARYEYTVNNVFIVNNIITAKNVTTPAVEVPVSLRGHSILTLLANHPLYSARQSLVVRAELSGVVHGSPMSIVVGNPK